MTVSGHANYNWYGNAMSAKHRSAVDSMDTCDGVRAYIACNLELESAMTYLIDRLEQAGIADDTVIVLGTDHYPYGLELESSDRFFAALDELYGYDWYTPCSGTTAPCWCGAAVWRIKSLSWWTPRYIVWTSSPPSPI